VATRSHGRKSERLGLLGDKYLDLEVGDPRDSPLTEGDIVLNDQPIDYEGSIALRRGRRRRARRLLEGTRVLVARVNDGEGTLGRLINDPALAEEVRLTERGRNLLDVDGVRRRRRRQLINDQQLYDQLVRPPPTGRS
jgi:hypothetical protein